VSLPTPLASNDLLGDESSSINDNSAQIGMKRNELENTSRSLSQLTQNRGSLESTATESKAQLDELEAKLADAKAKHEIESKLVAELRTRVAEQSTQLRTIEADVIAAESDVSALKSEKTELEQALLRDKEEIRGLQRMMKEVEEEKTSLKNILEKLRKEARQQKGMVTIAKKQLATAETSRDAVQKEVDAEAVAAAAVPLPATPQALSPVPTGLSQRSNNPFDRLNRASSGVSVSSPPASEPSGVAILGAGAGAALGLVAAGAETLFHAAKDAVSPASEDEDEVKTEKEDVTPGSDVHATANPPPSDEVRSDSAVGRVADDAQATSRETSAGGPSDFIGDIGTPAPDPTEDAHEPEADLGHPPTDPELSQSPHVAGHGTTEAAMEAQPAPAGLSLDVEHRDPFEAERAAEHDPFGVPPSSSAVNPASGTSSGFDDSFGQTAPEHAASSGAHDDFDAMFSDLGEANPETRGETSLAPGKDHVADRGDDSSDEDDGPEDLEAPARYQSPPPASTTTAIPLARRSAPPPPSRGATAPTTDGFDPFASAEAQPGPKLGQERQLEPNLDIAMSENAKSSDPAPAQNSAPPLPSVPTKQSAKTASFDDDDFDFSDLPPAQVEQSAHHTGVPVNQGAFDDEFAGFDDEFGPSQPPSDGSVTKSYEIVSPGPRDEWGSNGPGQAPPSQMSFDDAFGGDFA
jgi:epidermal growth factor receptor substrate 15